MGEIRVVAELAPEDALGRVWPGQRGELRLAAFPWTQYGTVPVEGAAVADGVQDARVRVELTVRPGYDARIRLRNDLRGTVEIEVERVAPAELVLRAAGRALAAPRPPARAGDGP